MMPSPIKSETLVMRIGLLAALATVLQLGESCIPMPFPGMKLGLANMITLIAILNVGPAGAVQVAVVRTLAGSLLLGTFLSTGFMLSFAGAVTSAVVMSGMYVINRRMKLFSLIGISIVGAVANNAAQIGVVYGLFARGTALQWFIPYLLASAVLTGYLTGFFAARVCRKLSRSPLRSGRFSLPSFAATVPATGGYSVLSVVTLGVILAAFIAGIVVGDLRTLAVICAAAAVAAVWVDPARGRGVAVRFRKVLPYMLFVVIINIVGRAAGMEGVIAGAAAGVRLALFFLLAYLAANAIPRADLRHLTTRLLRPLDRLGINSGQLVGQVSYACAAVPALSQIVSYRFRLLKAVRGKRNKTTYAAASVTSALVLLLGGLRVE